MTQPPRTSRRPARNPPAGAGDEAVEHDGSVLEQLFGNPDFLIRRAHQLATAAFSEACADLDLTASQFSALVALRQREIVSQNELGRLIALDRSTTSIVLKSLRERALVHAQGDEADRRKTLLSLTDAGRLMLAKAEKRASKGNAAFLARLGEDESAQFLAMLRRLAKAPGTD